MKKKVLLGLLVALIVFSFAILIFLLKELYSKIDLLHGVVNYPGVYPEEVINLYKKELIEYVIFLIVQIFSLAVIISIFVLTIKSKTTEAEKQEKAERQERRLNKKLLQLNAKIEKINKKDDE